MLHPERHYLCLIIIIIASLFSNSINIVQPEHPILSILMLYLYNTLGLNARDSGVWEAIHWPWNRFSGATTRRHVYINAEKRVLRRCAGRISGRQPRVLAFIDFHPHLDLSSHSLKSLGMLLVYVFRVYDVSSRYILLCINKSALLTINNDQGKVIAIQMSSIG